MKRGFVLSYILVVLFLSCLFIGYAIKLSFSYLATVSHYQKLIFNHYAAKSILKMWRQQEADQQLDSWVLVDNKKMWYVRILKNKIYLMDDQEPKGKIIYCYEEN